MREHSFQLEGIDDVFFSQCRCEVHYCQTCERLELLGLSSSNSLVPRYGLRSNGWPCLQLLQRMESLIDREAIQLYL